MIRLTRRAFLPVFLAGPLGAQVATIRGTWTALADSTTLTGTWRARLDAADSDGWGTWELLDGEGKPLATGTWSARKTAQSWEGGWLAQVKDGRSYSGTWTADTGLPGEAKFVRLLEAALAGIQRGTFSAGEAVKGSWAIRAAAR